MKYSLLSVGVDAKTVKGEQIGYLTGILYLAPGDISGFEVCPGRSASCFKDCIYYAGHGAMSKVQNARIRRTKYYFSDREGFLHDLRNDLRSLVTEAQERGLDPVARLNGTSDINWNVHGVYDQFPQIQFVNYTKVLKYARINYPKNVYCLYSYSGENAAEAVRVLQEGMNVAFVYHPPIPDRLILGGQSWPVVDGDLHDLRFLDPKGTCVGLKAKGRARKDFTSAFVFNQQLDLLEVA